MSIEGNSGWHFATISRIAYMDAKESAPIAKELGYPTTKLLDNDGAECLLLENADTIVLAFRGTEPKEFSDIAADLKAWKRKSKTEGMVHAGFYDYLEKIWPLVLSELGPKSRQKKKLYICGHSLGGAMATLAASRLSAKITACYTYGSPRVGGKVWLQRQAFTHFRYVNNNDMVPRVPPRLLGFRHHGELCYINFYGNIRVLTPWQRIKDMWRGHYRAWCKLEFFDGARDHSIDLYERKCSKN